MQGYQFYTVTLNANGQKGKLEYGDVMCGDCLIRLEECGHKPN